MRDLTKTSPAYDDAAKRALSAVRAAELELLDRPADVELVWTGEPAELAARLDRAMVQLSVARANLWLAGATVTRHPDTLAM